MRLGDDDYGRTAGLAGFRGRACAIVHSLSLPLVVSYKSWTVRELALIPLILSAGSYR